MDMDIFLTVIKRLGRAIKLFFEILGIIQTILWLIGGGVVTSAGFVASLQNLPIIIPVALMVIGTGVLAYATVRTIHRYRSWNVLKSIPELDHVLGKALDIHICIGKLHDEVIKQNRRKNIKTKLRQTLAKKYLETIGITLRDLAIGINPDGTFTGKLYRKIRRFYGLKEGDYSTVLPHLKGYGRLLDKAKLGLKDAIQASIEYDQAKNEFMKSQLHLSVSSEIVGYINSLPELSYGLYSASIGANLAHESRDWYKDVPDSWIEQRDEAKTMLDTAYMKAMMWAKDKVRRAMFKELLK